ncbi:MAG: hypothetical protein AAGB48_01110 [Planctomycetota bacterium]
MPTPRRIAIGTLALSVVAFSAAVTAMAQKVARFNRDQLPPKPVFSPVDATAVLFGGHELRFDHQDAETGSDSIIVSFAGESLRLREEIPNELDAVPDLRRYEEWLRLYRMVIVDNMSTAQALEAVSRDELDDRLVMVVLRPPAGAVEAGGWGRVWFHTFQFDIYEFTEDGRILSDRYKFPTAEQAETPSEGELIEGTWQYDAAMQSIPPVSRPEPTSVQNASLALGWTFPVAGLSSLTAMASLIGVFVLGRDTRRPSPPADQDRGETASG